MPIAFARAQQGVTAPSAENGAVGTSNAVPTPIIKIDNQHDPFATVVTIEFGDRLGELLDTVSAVPIQKYLMLFSTGRQKFVAKGT